VTEAQKRCEEVDYAFLQDLDLPTFQRWFTEDFMKEEYMPKSSAQPAAMNVGVNVTKTVPVQEPALVSPAGGMDPKPGQTQDRFELGEQELLSPTSKGLTSDLPLEEAKKLEIKVPHVSHVPHAMKWQTVTLPSAVTGSSLCSAGDDAHAGRDHQL